MTQQLTSTILMIRPVGFKMNHETAVNNYYQKVITGITPEIAQEKALVEFDQFVDKLRKSGVEVIVLDDTLNPETPDSIFPNNWISFHADGRIGLYPMFAPNRRLERRKYLKMLMAQFALDVRNQEDFTSFEQKSQYLEGTGSMLLDRDNKIVYAAISARTDEEVLNEFCARFDYQPVTFHANQDVNGERLAIYHTNVMMCLTDKLAIVCLDCLDNLGERELLISSLKRTNKQIIEISEDQVNHFVGNMLGMVNNKGEKLIVMSSAALGSLSAQQKDLIERDYKILSSSLDTIEALGGGSARCMMAEVFLPKL